MTDPTPDADYDEERDTWACWWLAHEIIGEQVKSGERELPAPFVPSANPVKETLL